MSDLDETLDDVARALHKSERVVFLTGAGLSVASGIAPYRKSKDAVWENFITDWGTIAKFHDDPAMWWREFWLKAHGSLSASAKQPEPNAGHLAITEIAKRSSDTVVITQNIDGLHRRAGVPEEQLVEIHGRHDRFVCTSLGCARVNDGVDHIDLSRIDDDVIPLCDLCGSPLRPLVLLFDEMYDSHPAYNMRLAKRALNDAEIILFVGTSFSVGITDYAVRAGMYARATLVNVNVEAVGNDAFVDLIGPSEVVLPALARR
ncbi:MAG TPA: Sir2 family NAD-dependent protein deacetylase [Myxococcota bacterium]